jgi:hypothetical protein
VLIGKKYGWPNADDYTAFLSALSASIGDPMAERIRLKREGPGPLVGETPWGSWGRHHEVSACSPDDHLQLTRH